MPFFWPTVVFVPWGTDSLISAAVFDSTGLVRTQYQPLHCLHCVAWSFNYCDDNASEKIRCTPYRTVCSIYASLSCTALHLNPSIMGEHSHQNEINMLCKWGRIRCFRDHRGLWRLHVSYAPSSSSKAFAIYPIMLGWKTFKYYYENRRTPQRKAYPTQEKWR